MNASNEEPRLILLSKNNAKTLLVRNAIDQATLTKEAKLLQKERNTGERLFLKKKKHLLERQSQIMYEKDQRPLSSCSLQLENSVAKWNSETNLAGILSPKPARKETNGNSKRETLLSSSFFLSYKGDDTHSSPRPRSKTFSSLTRSNSMISLPDIHATSHGLTGEKKSINKKLSWQMSNSQKTGEAVCVLDDWNELRKCRYLRTCSAD